MLRLIRSLGRSISDAVASDPEVRRLVARHPRFFRFLAARFDTARESGLHLTLGALISLYLLYLFLSTTGAVIGQPALVNADVRTINLLQIFRSPPFTRTMLFITYLGAWQVVFCAVVLASAVLLYSRRWREAVALAVAVMGAQALSTGTKLLMHRPRPPLLNAIVHEASYSFPSGHTMVATAFFGFIGWLLFRQARTRAAKVGALLLPLPFIFLIAFSRMYLGVHYPTDVASGFLLGAAWLVAVITALRLILAGREGEALRPPERMRPRTAVITALCIFLWVTAAYGYFKTHPAPRQEEPSGKVVEVQGARLSASLFHGLPRYSEDLTGAPQEPINIIVVGSRRELDAVFRAAGWEPMDQVSVRSLSRALYAFVTGKHYANAPGTPTFWRARPNDFSYEKQAGGVSQREHIHFWRTSYVLQRTGQNIWFATAHFDRSIALVNSYIPSHEIDPNIDKERDRVSAELRATGMVSSMQKFHLVQPELGRNQAGSGFFTYGLVDVLYLM